MKKILGQIHHIGYLVKSIDKSTSVLEAMGFSVVKEKYFDEDRKSYINFVDGNGVCYELIEPAKDSDVYPLLRQYRNMPYHVCYMVDNMAQTIKDMGEIGFLVTKEKQRALAISEKAEVTFMAHARIGIVELLEIRQ